MLRITGCRDGISEENFYIFKVIFKESSVRRNDSFIPVGIEKIKGEVIEMVNIFDHCIIWEKNIKR